MDKIYEERTFIYQQLFSYEYMIYRFRFSLKRPRYGNSNRESVHTRVTHRKPNMELDQDPWALLHRETEPDSPYYSTVLLFSIQVHVEHFFV